MFLPQMGPEMGMTELPVAVPADLGVEAAKLAQRCRDANSGAMRVVNSVSGQLEGRANALLARHHDKLQAVIEAALTAAYGVAAGGSRLGRLGARGSTALSALSGAAGGFFGLGGAVIELPVSVGIILHAIQEVAQEHGYDITEEAVRRQVLEVFASGGPLPEDDGVNTAFLTARLTLHPGALGGAITTAATRIVSSLAPRLGAKAVPILGAFAGAGLNAVYTRYYREMAHVHFARLRLIEQHGEAAVIAAFSDALARQRLGA